MNGDPSTMAESTEQFATNPIRLRELATDVTMTLAPEESAILAAYDGYDDAEVLRLLTTAPRKDQRLGFGLDAAEALVSAVVWIGVDEAVRRITDAVADRAGHARPRWWPFRRRRGQAVRTVEVPALTGEQLRIVEGCVLDAARAAGLKQERASRVADGVVKRLAVGPEAPPEIEP